MLYKIKPLNFILLLVLYGILFSDINAQTAFEKSVSIINRIETFHKNNDFYVKWNYLLKNSAYTDSDFNICSFHSRKKDSLIAYWNLDYSDSDDIYEFAGIRFNNESVDIIIKDNERPEICKLKTTNKRMDTYLNRNVLPYLFKGAKGIWKDTAKYHYKVVNTCKGDSLFLINKDSSEFIKYFINQLGQWIYYSRVSQFEIAGLKCMQTIIYSDIKYKDTIIDISPYLALDTCIKINYNKPKIEKPQIPYDSFFLNKKFNLIPLAKYIDTSVFSKSNKVILLEYGFLSCLPCLIAMQTYSKLLDSLEDKIEIIIIDPIDPKTKSVLVDRVLEKYNVKGRVKYYLLNEGNQDITFGNYINSYPLLLVIDKNGIVRALKRGINSDENALDAIHKLLNPFLETKNQ
jgi:thiol-disulfide isomerase/thioredoxin